MDKIKISRIDTEHFDLSLYGENGTAVVSTTEYTDASGGKEREYTLILSLFAVGFSVLIGLEIKKWKGKTHDR